jgi:hypothetical protein
MNETIKEFFERHPSVCGGRKFEEVRQYEKLDILERQWGLFYAFLKAKFNQE